jgi:hypothetical protein
VVVVVVVVGPVAQALYNSKITVELDDLGYVTALRL